MANGIQSTFAGNVTRDVALHRTQSGVSVANVDVAVAHRVKNGDQWEDGETTYVQCTVWRDLAEHAAESLRKGTPVLVTGTVFEEAWEGKNGNTGIQKKCDVDELAVSLRWGTAEYRRAARGGRERSGASGGGFGGRSGGSGETTGSGDGWAPSAPAGGDVWNQPGSYNDETPF